MRLLIINPNSTAAMTESIADAARAVARSATQIIAKNPPDGPPAIQGREDGEASLPGLFALHAQETAAGHVDAAIIACFDDTGLWELKRDAPHPVIGIGEAGYHAAALSGRRFSVVTTLSVSVPILEENIATCGFAERCAKVRASEVPVLEFETNKEAATQRLSDEIARAVAEDGCDSVVLGCAGMADLAANLTDRFNLPVIDGVAAAVGFAEMLGKGKS
ncbi:MAG: aspartate/glutamate racemase family protein [Rhodobacteraceae bacterium]|nr:aspartate/glutamate racemase family protein [Paracoccaceae bacterium]